jgi:hypothetical protein
VKVESLGFQLQSTKIFFLSSSKRHKKNERNAFSRGRPTESAIFPRENALRIARRRRLRVLRCVSFLSFLHVRDHRFTVSRLCLFSATIESFFFSNSVIKFILTTTVFLPLLSAAVSAIRDSPNYRKFQRATARYATAFYALSELVQVVATDVSEFVLNSDEEEEEEERRESGRTCGTSSVDDDEEEDLGEGKENDGKRRREEEKKDAFKLYSKPVPRRLRRILECARQPEVMEAVSDFIAVGVMKSVQRVNEFGSSLAPHSSLGDNDEGGSSGGGFGSSGLQNVEQKMADFVSRVTETVLKTEESALRFNSVFTNCVESVVNVTKKALTLSVGSNGGEGEGEAPPLTYETVVELAMREIEKRKKFLFDLIDVGVRSFVSENQRNEANPFNDVIKALETNPQIGFKLIDSVATKVVETYVAETHKSGFVSEMARQSNKRRGPRSRGSIADLPAEEFRASASFAMEKRLSMGEDEQEGEGTKKNKKSGSPKTPLERAMAQQRRREERENNEIEEEENGEDDMIVDESGDVPDQTPRFNGLPPRRPSTANLAAEQQQSATTGGNFRTFEGELAKDLFDVVRATPNSRKFAVEMATQCVRSAMSAIVFALVDVVRVELRKASRGFHDWIQTGPEFDGVIDIRMIWAKRMAIFAVFLAMIRVAWSYAVGNDVLS